MNKLVAVMCAALIVTAVAAIVSAAPAFAQPQAPLEDMAGIAGIALDSRGALIIRAFELTPRLRSLILEPAPFPLVAVATDDFKVHFKDGPMVANMSYDHFVDSSLIRGPLVVTFGSSSVLARWVTYLENQTRETSIGALTPSDEYRCSTSTTGSSSTLRCYRGRLLVYVMECGQGAAGAYVCRTRDSSSGAR